jgi:multiple antibiotic resistance protein
LFVAVDAIGNLPLYISMTEDVAAERRRIIIVESVITASIVAVAFVWFGPVLLRFLGISVPDFMIAGGLLLLAIALAELLTGEKRQRQADPGSLGAVPIGIPLITGPAVLTTCILLRDIHGRGITTLAVVINIILAGLTFLSAEPITRAIGRTGTKTVSKLASLLLAAIAVMLIRRGVFGIMAL